MSQALGSADGLLDDYWAPEPTQIERRELVAELFVAGAFLAAAAALVVFGPVEGERSLALWAAFVLAYAAVGNIRFHVGATFAVPTQLVLVPMLLILPPAVVPLLVATGLVLSSLPDVLRGKDPKCYVLFAISDAWHSLGAAVVFVIAGEQTGLLVFAASFGAQAIVESLNIVMRAWAARGIPPHRQSGVVGMIQLVDGLLWPIGWLAAEASRGHELRWAWILTLPVLLGLLARDRAKRVAQAQERLEALRHERSRVEQAVRRVGDAFAANLDRSGLLELTLHTAIDAAGASAGRVDDREAGLDGLPLDALAALASAEALAGEHGVTGEGHAGEWHAAASPVKQLSGATAVLAVVRPAAAFDADERDVVAYLAAQVGVSIENAELHERLRHQAVTDGLTGLANHRRFQERLEREVSRAREHGNRLSLLLLDIDDFKAVNDTYGHQLGDLVLHEVAGALKRCCRGADEPARYGGEEFAVVLPEVAPEVALKVAERVRAAIENLDILTPRGDHLKVTTSLGLAVDESGEPDGQVLLGAADAALYEAKGQGKNRVVAGAITPPPSPSAPRVTEARARQ